MTTSATRTDHFFPRVHATAKLLTTLRRAAGLTRRQLARKAKFTPSIGYELVRRIETGRHPFPHPEAARRLVRILGLDASALFLAQCEDFAQLDRRDPRLVLGVEDSGREIAAPAGLCDEEIRGWARQHFRELDDRIACQGGPGLWRTWACIRWSAIRCERMLPDGASVIGFRPVLLNLAEGERPWVENWMLTLENWLGIRAEEPGQ
jgi:transcriptional regulator with XRE-family HTH domain